MSYKILIIGPAWIGDMVMAQSLFKLIRQHHQDAEIDVLAPAWTFSLLKCMPEVAKAVEMPLTHGEVKLRTRYQLAKTLRASRYDQAIVLQNSFKSALVPWLAGIPRRTGWVGEFRYFLLNDARRLDKKRYPLMIEQYMALGLPAGAALPEAYPYPEFSVSPSSQSATLAKIKPVWRGRPVLALGAGAAFGPAKRWPETYFADVANQKLSEGWDVWLFGSQADRPITDKIMQLTQNRCENVSGRTELFETIDLLSLVSGVVTNDSGLMHMAAALKKPLVAVYGSTSPAFTPPLSAEAKILKLDLDCQPCFKRDCPLSHHRCMRDLKPALVLAAMAEWRQ
ncbi:ADP-heptose--LPS heptosyltransferase 2 [Aquicella siphonis]|uniref:lipopolysaccharide heptosyltransferase II n=1 Tax=Aquicella siphonis TaxID=254247 RepID=A0A5E4PEI2_9COXI|nr:lipopolysaccharide heptosyltransferase II [Aquicella siphonis]VVC74888.1 ADP-heptose--LPS heptosyltransferase 2 [Aquicella siphonis]